MTNDPKGGNDERNSFPPGLRQALEQLFIKHIMPLFNRLDALESTLKAQDARELVNRREALLKCEEENQQLKYDLIESQTNVDLLTDARNRWRSSYEGAQDDKANLGLEIAFLKSKIQNNEETGNHDR